MQTSLSKKKKLIHTNTSALSYIQGCQNRDPTYVGGR